MEGASTCRRGAYVGCCCAALALIGCPQVLTDDFLAGQGAAGSPGAGGQGGGSAGTAGAGTDTPDASSSGSGGGPDAGSASCDDGVRNQEETGVDCGGPCPACCTVGPFRDVVQVEGLGADDRYGPALSADGQRLYFSRVLPNGNEDLFRARRGANGAVFTELQPVPQLNGPSLEGSPFASSDGLTLFFFSDRNGGSGSRDLWQATRASTLDDFANPALVPGVNSAAMELLPWLSADGSTLWFVSTRNGGSGGSDIWEAVRSSPSGSFGAPRPRADLNTSAREEGFTLSADELTVILASTRDGGDLDLFIGTRAERSADFGPLTLLGELSSPQDDMDPFLSADGRELYFVSSRDGDYRIYHALRDCP